jgi:hypothetical protein
VLDADFESELSHRHGGPRGIRDSVSPVGAGGESFFLCDPTLDAQNGFRMRTRHFTMRLRLRKSGEGEVCHLSQ